MSTPRTIRCSSCSQLLSVAPNPQPVRVKSPGCHAVLQVPGTASAPLAPRPKAGLDFGDLPPPQVLREVVQQPRGYKLPTPSPEPIYAPKRASPTVGPHYQSTSPRPSRSGGLPVWLYVLVGSLVGVPLLCCGGLGVIGFVAQRVDLSALGGSLNSTVDTSVVASFPELGPSEQSFPSGVTSYFVQLAGPSNVPASQMVMRIYVPPGDHAAGSLPCMLVAPAGTPLLHGVTFARGEDYHDETLPYADAGMVVIQYSLDGPVPESAQASEEATMRAMAAAYPIFRAAGGGVVNGRVAVQYALEKLPMVDSNRIYCAGHSSAGNVALLLAAYEPKISRCAAYAAAWDFESRLGDALSDPSLSRAFPGIQSFVRQSSPVQFANKIACPVMAFQARDDDNVPFSDAQAFVDKMKLAGKDVHFVQANRGGHYDSMISAGIPAAIQWLKD